MKRVVATSILFALAGVVLLPEHASAFGRRSRCQPAQPSCQSVCPPVVAGGLWYVRYPNANGVYVDYGGSPYFNSGDAVAAYNRCNIDHSNQCVLFGPLVTSGGWYCEIDYTCGNGYASTMSGTGSTKQLAYDDARANAVYGCYNMGGLRAVTRISYEPLNFGGRRPCGGGDVEGKLTKEVGETEKKAERRHKSFTWGTVSTGKCEIRNGYTLTIYDDGSWNASGKFKCNAGGIISCEIDVRHSAKDANGNVLFDFGSWSKSAGPGSERDINESGRDDRIRDRYNSIQRMSLPNHCEWGP